MSHSDNPKVKIDDAVVRQYLREHCTSSNMSIRLLVSAARADQIGPGDLSNPKVLAGELKKQLDLGDDMLALVAQRLLKSCRGHQYYVASKRR